MSATAATIAIVIIKEFIASELASCGYSRNHI